MIHDANEALARPAEPHRELKPFAITHQYWVPLPDGDRATFSVVAGMTCGKLDVTVSLPARYDDDPEAVPGELLERVRVAMGQLRGKVDLRDLTDLGA